jgi:hypothetical protein
MELTEQTVVNRKALSTQMTAMGHMVYTIHTMIQHCLSIMMLVQGNGGEHEEKHRQQDPGILLPALVDRHPLSFRLQRYE